MGMRTKSREARIQQDRDILDAIIQAVTDIGYDELIDISTSGDIDSLASNTHFDSIEVSPETIFISNDRSKFEASGIVYVELNYGDKRDNFSMPDSFPATITGNIGQDGSAKVTDIQVDTSSFYE
jgi:hypothetical protein